MVSASLEILGMVLSILGWLMEMLACGLPMWKVNAYLSANIVVSQSLQQGLWMSCVAQSTGQMQCKTYDSVLGLHRDLQLARAMTVLSSVLGALGLLITVAGAQCTKCVPDESNKARIVNAGGVIFIISGLFVLVPVCWMANSIIAEFNDPMVSDHQKQEMGASIYIGWAASALLVAGGAVLCCSCPNRQARFSAKYAAPKRTVQNGDYDKKNYV
ncbi:claudin 5a [Erpetoichthys calabaricus]|uniref:Claudin n=1 Tax=Erpetoichthys calabaricus TaxID=27687 RepID=A0A8C4TBL9_ERPCA|nr:claudin 5a [Erpetoichthys calabaricus]